MKNILNTYLNKNNNLSATNLYKFSHFPRNYMSFVFVTIFSNALLYLFRNKSVVCEIKSILNRNILIFNFQHL